MDLRIHFNPDSEHLPWPGPWQGPEARAGETWVGPKGFLGILETALGLGGPNEPDAARAASLVSFLKEERSAFWHASATIDPVGCARELLRWRDTLLLHGWAGEALEGRIPHLAALHPKAHPGFPDRLKAVQEKLRGHKAGIHSIMLPVPVEELPRLWREILKALQDEGTAVHVLLPVPGESGTGDGDLGNCKARGFVPRVDGSLQLLRPHGPTQAAEDLAAWLAAQGDLEGTVIIGSDALLDAALRRFGLPTLAGQGPGGNSLLQILPLVLSMGWNPPDPQRALELLTLPEGPVPHDIANRLASALHEWPAVDSDRWRTERAEGVMRLSEDRRDRVATRIEILFRVGSEGATYPVALAREKVDALRIWMRGKKGKVEESPWNQPLAQLDNFVRLLDAMGLDSHTAPQLQKIVAQATEPLDTDPSFPHQAGLVTLPGPEALLGPVRRVVWWNFVRGTEPSALAGTLSALSSDERSSLAEIGVLLPQPGAEASRIARRWRGPLELAREQLILVCSATGEDGEPAHPHPLWDEVVANLAHRHDAYLLTLARPISGPAPIARVLDLLAPPIPVREWTAPRPLSLRAVESPSSLESFIGCPFRWTLRYACSLYPGSGGRLGAIANQTGKVLHEVLARTLTEVAPSDPDRAETRACELFEELGPRLVAQLFQPGFQSERARAIYAAGKSARAISKLLADHHWTVLRSEEIIRNPLSEDLEMGGRVDLVIGPPETVLDFKGGSEKFRRDLVKKGAAFQLAAYARILCGEGRPFPAVGYFMLNTQALLSADVRLVAGSNLATAPSAEQTWCAAWASIQRGRANLLEGTISAPIPKAGIKPEPSHIAEGHLVLETPCMFCDYDAICGKRWEVARG